MLESVRDTRAHAPLDARLYDYRDPDPCAGCLRAAQCRREAIACAAFATFARTGQRRLWARAPRVPDRRIFEIVFSDEPKHVTRAPRVRTRSGPAGRTLANQVSLPG
jgi:hypothetical protein